MKRILLMILGVALFSAAAPASYSAEIQEKDLFLLFGKAKQYRKDVAHMLNELALHYPACQKRIAPNTAGMSKDKSKPGNPSFFVHCGDENVPEVVRFDLADIRANKIPATKIAIDRSAAIKICINEARSKATIPSSVDWSGLSGVNFDPKLNGNAVMGIDFTAENAIGGEQKFKIFCFFDGQELTEATIKSAD